MIYNTPVGADLRVCPHVANRTISKRNTTGRHIGLPLQYSNTKTTIKKYTNNTNQNKIQTTQHANTKTTIKNDTNPVGVDLCVYPHVANRTVSKRNTTGKHANKNRTVPKRNTTGRHIGLPLQYAYQNGTNDT